MGLRLPGRPDGFRCLAGRTALLADLRPVLGAAQRLPAPARASAGDEPGGRQPGADLPGCQLARARDLRHVRRLLPRALRSAPHPAAVRLGRPPAAQGPSARLRRSPIHLQFRRDRQAKAVRARVTLRMSIPRPHPLTPREAALWASPRTAPRFKTAPAGEGVEILEGGGSGTPPTLQRILPLPLGSFLGRGSEPTKWEGAGEGVRRSPSVRDAR